MSVHVIIPVRLESTRLPGKALLPLNGRPMLEHVYRRVCRLGPSIDSIVIASDSQFVLDVAQSFGAMTCLTKSTHQSGTERIGEVILTNNYHPDDIIVSVQCDEPLLPPQLISELICGCHNHPLAAVVTLYEPINEWTELIDTSVVKVVFDASHCALYFSRAPIPWWRDHFDKPHAAQRPLPENSYYRHIGLYGYRASFVNQYNRWALSVNENLEALEQLRILHYGEKIQLIKASVSASVNVNTKEDLAKVRKLIGENSDDS